MANGLDPKQLGYMEQFFSPEALEEDRKRALSAALLQSGLGILGANETNRSGTVMGALPGAMVGMPSYYNALESQRRDRYTGVQSLMNLAQLRLLQQKTNALSNYRRSVGPGQPTATGGTAQFAATSPELQGPSGEPMRIGPTPERAQMIPQLGQAMGVGTPDPMPLAPDQEAMMRLIETGAGTEAGQIQGAAKTALDFWKERNPMPTYQGGVPTGRYGPLTGLPVIPQFHAGAAPTVLRYQPGQGGTPGEFAIGKPPGAENVQSSMERIAGAGAAKISTSQPFHEAVQQKIGQNIAEDAKTFQKIPSQIWNLRQARNAVDQAGRYVGTGGEFKLEIAKFFNNNFGTSITPTEVANAEFLRTSLFRQILDNLKQMDAQPSQQQQQVMQKAMGQLSTDPGALPLIIDLSMELLNQARSRHNARVDVMIEGARRDKYPTYLLETLKIGDPVGGIDINQLIQNLNPETRKRLGY